MDNLPFIQENLSDNVKIRTFKTDVESGELMWHRDREDRLVEILECNNWKYQSDNTLPLEMKKGDKIFIPKGEYHRVIKGDGDLVVRVTMFY
jgi:quercetin dioxygenase-like cupin family protein